MTGREFCQLYDARPSQPFAIHLADGREVLVRHREFALPSPAGRTVIVIQENRQ